LLAVRQLVVCGLVLSVSVLFAWHDNKSRSVYKSHCDSLSFPCYHVMLCH